jgi:hypothetical protein
VLLQVVSVKHEAEPGASASSPSSAESSADSPHGASPASDPATTATWLSRARVDAALNAVLALQDAARKLQAHLRIVPPPREVRDPAAEGRTSGGGEGCRAP